MLHDLFSSGINEDPAPNKDEAVKPDTINGLIEIGFIESQGTKRTSERVRQSVVQI